MCFYGPIDNRSVLVLSMAWYQTGSKPLNETMVIQVTDAYLIALE